VSINIRPFVAQGLIKLQQIDPAQLSPGQLGQIIRSAVEGQDGGLPAKVIVVDSLNGYLHSMPEERFLAIQLHELLTYLGHRGVVTFLILAQHGLIGAMQAPVDATYIADAVILLRYFEAFGEVKQAISVVKKRSGAHERSIREFRIDSQGLRVGEALKTFQGVLTGTPKYSGDGVPLMESRPE
jgi:circadian clock protein KaiC